MTAANPLPADGTDFRERWVPTAPGVALRLLQWTPRRESSPPLLLVPGWISGIGSWTAVLEAVIPDRRVVVVETRDKPSARFERRLRVREMGIPAFAEDLLAAARASGIAGPDTVAFGSSLGATAILEAMKNDRLPVGGAFLVGPNARFRTPWWGRPLLLLPPAVYRVARHLAVLYIERFRLDREKEPEQAARYRNAILGAEPRRLMLSARALADYTVWDRLETVARPVAVAWAPTDRLHEADAIRRIVETLPDARPIPCPSNRFMHSREIVPHLDRFVGSLPAGAHRAPA